MASSRKSKEVAKGFTEAVVETIDAIGSMVDQLNQVGLTDTTSNEMDIISALASKYEEELVVMFLDKNGIWENILNKNTEFFVSDVLELFADIPADMSCLIIPVKAFRAHQAGELDDCPDFPITAADIEGLWDYFNQLLKGALLYNSLTGNKYDLSKMKKRIDAL